MHKGHRVYLLQKIIRSVSEIDIDICSSGTSLNTSYYGRSIKGRQDISSFDGVLEFCVNTAQYLLKIEVIGVSFSPVLPPVQQLSSASSLHFNVFIVTDSSDMNVKATSVVIHI